MTGFDLGDPAADADDPTDEQANSSSEQESELVGEPPTPETEPESEPEPDSELESEPEPDSELESEPELESEADPTDRDPTETGPAFPYSEVKQSPLYARKETWTEFEDQLDFTVTPELRRMGIRDDELREVHDVVLELALDNIEEIPERLAEKRRER
ncbi:uncharacterized protein Nmag_3970 (plasmid) [Natrialba magadii ATCC 43099]|uniref:Uncharacterized protein n=1 Tax=Natrialba magadii (strain ATCC 43099 / DSM 3394 / CCM 3739 / CIP 104546 / IAM 13178 / JCM 8861 / NBRC 102185 / NCIMB 2190 / MS3) TaxID=547559 RepID=D3T1P7_NATMM|nr:hypothetical protein [Natrialba magadii]ADD07506.1 uncharacterized protein Nmag_3970 [Natrialba magadii ATCC 43099]ELY26538.1 hypothetical protein C500_15285 [Natrialba magadii ATCC 43099]